MLGNHIIVLSLRESVCIPNLATQVPSGKNLGWSEEKELMGHLVFLGA